MFQGQTVFTKKGAPVIYRGKHWIFTPLNLYFRQDSIFLLSFSIKQKLMTRDRVREKVGKSGPRKRRENRETQFNSNLSSNQEPPLLLPQSHLPAAKSIQAQPLHSATDKRVVTWNMFIYSQSLLKHEDGCLKLILCKETNCQGKALWLPALSLLLLNASWYGNISMLTGIKQGFLSGLANAGLLCWFWSGNTEMFNLLKATIL